MSFDGINGAGARGIGRRAVLVGLGATAFAAPARALAPRERIIRLYCPETDERCDETYWRNGVYLADAMARIDWLMRDFHRNVMATIDPALVDLLQGIAEAIGTRHPITILSGYRTRATNSALRHEGLPAAAKSQHLVARAADIAIPGVSTGHLHRAALHQEGGGVGAYDGYVHVDTGPTRTWLHHAHDH